MGIHIEENVLLSSLTTMLVGGKARFFVRIVDVEQIAEAVSFAQTKDLPVFVLGGGSNLLVSDTGFSGLVIKIESKGIYFEEQDNESACVVVGAGEVWDDLVAETVAQKYWGIENLSLIPGTVGGAVVQNIGAYGVEICDNIFWVEAFDMQTLKIKVFSQKECLFGYRTSIFKTNRNLIVVRVALSLACTERMRIEYQDIKNYFLEKNTKLSLENIRVAIIAIRTEKMPGLPLGTAGSFFKNPIVSFSEFERLKRKFPDIKHYLQGDGTIKLSAAWLLDKIGEWRGMRRGNVGVYEKQALVLVNYGGAKAQEILNLAQNMKESIYKKTGVMLEEEVVIV